MCSALARKIKGQRNLANLRAPNAREHCDRARGGSGRGLFENKAWNCCFRSDFD